MTNPQLAEIEERLASFYEAQIQARQRSRSVGRKVMLVIAALAVLGFFLCAGLMPALFTSGGGNPGASTASAFSCGVESLGAGSPNLQPGKLTAEQVQNAKTMITVGRNMGVPARGWVVAVENAYPTGRFFSATIRVQGFAEISEEPSIDTESRVGDVVASGDFFRASLRPT